MESSPSSPNKQERVSLSTIEKELGPQVFEGLPGKKKAQILEGVAGFFLKVKRHSGPLPDAETLAEYEDLVPGSANRIITTFEKQVDHRIALETKVVGRQTFQSGLGQVFAFLIGIGALSGGVTCVLYDHDTAGIAIATGGVISLGIAFLRSTTNQKEELEAKKPNK